MDENAEKGVAENFLELQNKNTLKEVDSKYKSSFKSKAYKNGGNIMVSYSDKTGNVKVYMSKDPDGDLMSVESD